MDEAAPSKFLERVFRFVVARRWWVVAFWALVTGPAAYFATRVDQDNSIDRLIVPNDPESVAGGQFEKVFGTGEYVILLCEAPDPYAPDVLKKVDELERKLQEVPRVESNSALSIFRRVHAGFDATPEHAAE